MLNPQTDITHEAARILDAADAEGIPLRLLGGLAIHLRCPGMQADTRLQRSYGDMDFAILSQGSTKTKALFQQLGYAGNKAFNALHGYQRLMFYDEQNERKIDIFVDRMQMCHILDFRTRLTVDKRTLPLADLLMTKLQIVEVNEKDITDTIALLNDHALVENDQGINAPYIASLTAQDWGLNKTFELNLRKMLAYVDEHNFPIHVHERLKTLLSHIEKQPKSMKWKARAMVGERVRWYETPEEGR
ncbi:MAG: hypothetical protein NVSMB38_30910 [Ktedonobacteraceae bacterium]